MDEAIKLDPTREKILEEAERLFAEKGFHAVSVREITTAARVHLSAVNYHFGGKKKLYMDVFRYRWVERAKRVAKPILELENAENFTPKQVIRAVIEAFLNFNMSEDERYWHSQLVIKEMAKPSEALDLIYEEVMNPMFSLIGRLLGRAISEDVDDLKLKLAVLSFFSQILYFNFSRPAIMKFLDQGYSDDVIEQLVNHITEFTLQGIEVCKKQG